MRCVLVLGLLVAAGCATRHEARFNKGRGLNGYEVLVVPFRESPRRQWYAESKRGESLAAVLKKWAIASAEAEFAEGETADHVVRAAREWTRELRPKDWRQLARGLGAQYLVEGDLVELRTSSPTTIGLYDGRARAEYRVIDLHQGRVAYRGEARARFGSDDMADLQFSTRFDSAPTIELQLLNQLGEQIGKDLYGYEDD